MNSAKHFKAVFAVGVVVALGTFAGPASAAPNFSCGDNATCVPAGWVWQGPGWKAVSPNGYTTFQLNSFSDGNMLQVFHNGDPQLIVGNGGGDYAVWQHDGNLVIYSANGTARWASNTGCGFNVCTLAVQNDGNVVIYNANLRPIWATNTAW